jgi:hypothetical protein
VLIRLLLIQLRDELPQLGWATLQQGDINGGTGQRIERALQGCLGHEPWEHQQAKDYCSDIKIARSSWLAVSCAATIMPLSCLTIAVVIFMSTSLRACASCHILGNAKPVATPVDLQRKVD